jgi:hypothetical protein
MLEIRNPKGHVVWGTGPSLRITALASVVAAAALRYRDSLLPSYRDELMQTAEYVFILSASVAMVALYAGFAERWRLHRIFQLPGLIFLSASLLAAGVYKLGMHQFGGFDEGLVVHAAACYAQGLKPYVDFPCTMPPLFMAGVRFSVSLLGLKWSSLALLSSTFAALTCLWMFALLRIADVPRHWALAIAVCVEVATMLEAPFWWYNNSSAVSTVLLLLSVLACLQREDLLLPWISLSCSLAMVLASKPNVEPACLMVLALLATKAKSSWAKTLSACACALALAWLICRGAQMSPAALLKSYAEVAALRGSPFMMYPFRNMTGYEGGWQAVFTVIVVLCFGALFAISARQQPHLRRHFAVFAIVCLTALEMACTNAEYETLNLVPMLVASAFLCIRPWEKTESSAGRKTVLAALLSVFFVMSVFFAMIHLRILGIGERMFYEPLPTTTIQSGFFSGLQASPRLQKVLLQTSEVLSRYPSKKVFFGPRMEFEYAVFNKPVTPGMPLLWDVGNLFPQERFPYFLLNFQREDPDLLIFLWHDYTRMGPVGFYISNTATYQRIETYSELTVYVRKKDVPITYVHFPGSALAPSR